MEVSFEGVSFSRIYNMTLHMNEVNMDRVMCIVEYNFFLLVQLLELKNGWIFQQDNNLKQLKFAIKWFVQNNLNGLEKPS